MIISAALATATGSFILLHWYFRHNLKVEDSASKKKRKASDADSSREAEFLPPLPDPIVHMLRCVLEIHARCDC